MEIGAALAGHYLLHRFRKRYIPDSGSKKKLWDYWPQRGQFSEARSMPPWREGKYVYQKPLRGLLGEIDGTKYYRHKGYGARRIMRKAAFVGGHPVKYTRGRIQQELKYFDKQDNLSELDTTTWSDAPAGHAIIPLFAGSSFGISVGTGPENRLGRKIWIKKIQIKSNFYRLGQANNTNILLQNSLRARIMVVEDTQTNGVAMTLDCLLEHVTTLYDAVHSFLNMATIGRFKVYFDRTYNMESNRFVSNGASDNLWDAPDTKAISINFSKTFSGNGKSIEYDNSVGTSGTVDEVTRSNIYFIIIPEFAGAASSYQNATLGEFSVRTRFNG